MDETDQVVVGPPHDRERPLGERGVVHEEVLLTERERQRALDDGSGVAPPWSR